jgi:hypothetical protein
MSTKIIHGSHPISTETQMFGIDLNNPDCLIPIPNPDAFKPGTFSGEDFDNLLDEFDGIGRGEMYERDDRGQIKLMSLAEMLSKRVAGRHNKNVIFILFGDLGSGKSMALLKLALSCAMWLAALKGGKPSDYFQFSNIAVIDPEMLQEKLANLKQYGIYILDDAGPGYDARTFMSKGNRDLNYILQTCRTSNNIILVSAPHGAMLDITIHRVAQYYAEVSEVRHDEGLTFLKVFRLVRVFREGKIFYVYMSKGNTVSKRYYCGLPPKSLKKKYDVVRDAQAKIIAQRRAEREAEERAKESKGTAKDAARAEAREAKEQERIEREERAAERERKRKEALVVAADAHEAKQREYNEQLTQAKKWLEDTKGNISKTKLGAECKCAPARAAIFARELGYKQEGKGFVKEK